MRSLEETYISVVRSLGVTPNHLTIAGLVLATATPIAAYYGSVVAVVVLMTLSALADALDGYTARALKASSKWGAFLDSTADRVADAMYVTSLAILGLNHVLCFLLLTASFLISYTRARGEALGLSLKGVGIVERQERVVILIVIAALSAYDKHVAELGALALLLLSVVTVFQRVLYARRGLSG